MVKTLASKKSAKKNNKCGADVENWENAYKPWKVFDAVSFITAHNHDRDLKKKIK